MQCDVVTRVFSSLREWYSLGLLYAMLGHEKLTRTAISGVV